MKSTLVVKNFGPIKNVNLELRNVNVFIGPQATGKSALAKIYTIFKAPRKFFYKTDTDEQVIVDNKTASKDFINVLKDYNIDSFLNEKTRINFESDLHTLTYANNTLKYVPKLLIKVRSLEKLTNNFALNRQRLLSELMSISEKFVFFYIRASRILSGEEKGNLKDIDQFESFNEDTCVLLFKEIRALDEDLSTNTALYIPAERNFINIIKKSALNLQLNQVPIPKHILSFGAELERLSIQEIDLGFIQKGLSYKIVNGKDRIFIGGKKSILLSEAASGVQSVIPLLAPIMNKTNVSHRSFVIEEPELNLFPIAQYQLIQHLESIRHDPFGDWEDYGTIHTYTTHSPYILSALNNLLYAHKVKRMSDNLEKEVEKIVKADIDPKSFRAYQINNGFAQSIYDETVGLIEENYIDEASDKINEDFDSLMELTNETAN